MKIAVALPLVAVTLFAAPASFGSDLKTFQAKLAAVEANDHEALLAIGVWALDRDRAAWAEQCFRRIEENESSPAYPNAVFHLASIDLEREDFESASRRLRILVGKFNHPEARRILDEAASAASNKQRALALEGDELYKSRAYEKARKKYAEAYALFPKKGGSAAFVPRHQLLHRLARTTERIDERFFEAEIDPVQRSIHRCGRCSSGGGFVRCTRCGGKGTERVLVRVSRRRGKIYKTIRCRVCGGAKHNFCPDCVGMQSRPDNKRLTKKERDALVKVINRARSLKVLKRPFKSALAEVESIVLRVEESATLNFFRGVPANYSLGARIRSAFSSVPPSDDEVTAAGRVWLGADTDPRVRANFLLAYSTDFARYVQSFDVFRQARGKLDTANIPSASERGSEAIAPEVLVAFPDDYSSGWHTVRGIFRGSASTAPAASGGRRTGRGASSSNGGDGTNAIRTVVRIDGRIPHGVRFFAWKADAKTHFERLEKGPWKSRVDLRSRKYPFDTARRLASIEPGRQVTVVGRFLRDRLGYPRNWFEIWDVHAGLRESELKTYDALSEKLSMAFEDVELRNVGRVAQLFGVEMDFGDLPADRRVTCSAEAAAIGVFLDELAKHVGAKWRFDRGTARFATDPDRVGGRSVAAVVAELRAAVGGTVTMGSVPSSARNASSSVAKRTKPEPTAIPTDPAKIRALARRAELKADFRLAGRCYSKLWSLSKDDAKADAKRSFHRARLFYALTKGTPVSQLVGADDLARIRLKSSRGKTTTRIFRVLERSEDALTLRPSYGGTLVVPLRLVDREQALPQSRWRRENEVRMEKKLLEVAEAGARAAPTTLFFLALFAKTNQFEEKVTKFLSQASAKDEFLSLLHTYFPERADDLVKDWRLATGRKAEPVRTADAPAPPAQPETNDGDKERVDEPIPGAFAELFPFALKHFRAGGQYMRRTLPGMPEASRMRRRARDHLELAQEALHRLLAAEPQHETGSSLMPRVTLLLQTCVKDLGLFD